MLDIYIQGARPSGEDLQKRVLFWLGGPRKAKRYDICYGMALRSLFASGRLSLIGRVRPYEPLDDDIYKTDMARSLPELATKRHPSTLFDLANPVTL